VPGIFEVPGGPFDFKRQVDLHIALGVDPDVFTDIFDKFFFPFGAIVIGHGWPRGEERV
jgi:hypothetical protein